MDTIKKGSKGESVVKLQTALGIWADGDFGPNTDKAVRTFQISKGLFPDGIVGPNTWNALSIKEVDFDVRAIVNANISKLTSSLNNKNADREIFDPTKHLVVVAVRGYRPEMGTPNQNDRRIYDDAHFIVTPDQIIKFSGNTDPNGFRKGSGTGSGKGMAVLNTGVWFYGKGPHNGRPSFRQCAPVQVTRDGNPPYQDFGWFAINWHSGGDTTTSSLGCQTNKPYDYSVLKDFIYKKLDELDNPKLCNDWASNFGDKVRAFPYILIDMKEVQKGNLSV